MTEGVFVCSKHKFSSDPKKPLPEQEEQIYQHYRDVEHEYRVSKPCQNCTKKVVGMRTGKVPQPTPDVKNPRSIIVFCDNNNKCQNEYLAKLGVKP